MRKYLLFSLLISIFAMYLSCSKESISPNSSNTGKSGSLAKFAIEGNYMYTVSELDLRIYDVSKSNLPQLRYTVPIDWGVETIFTMGDYLFLGSQNGVHLYQIQADGNIVYKNIYRHFESCDPVVAEGQYAYSTIRSAVTCRVRDTINELHIIDISEINNPKKLSVVKMTFPIGLGINGNHLFVCDKEGIRILDVTDKEKPKEVNYVKNIDAVDVIVLGTHLLIIGKEKLTQLDCKDVLAPVILSTLNLK